MKLRCRIGLKGVVSKVRDSRYNSGRGNDWGKKTRAQRETLPIAGFALNANRFDGLYMGRIKGKQLVYPGKIDHGFDEVLARHLQARLKPRIRKTLCPTPRRSAPISRLKCGSTACCGRCSGIGIV